MSDTEAPKPGKWPRIKHEFFEFLIIFIYLTLFLGIFAWYRRLVLGEYNIAYLRYGVAVIKALILAKVIMIGDWLHLGRALDRHPLIVSTLYRAVIFVGWVALFEIVEKVMVNIFRGRGWMGGIHEIMSSGWYEILAASLVMFFTFIPFFAFRETERVLGEGTLRRLFFRKRPA
jgi:hypothetical protein